MRPVVFIEELKDIILIGAGGGDLIRFIYEHLPQVNLTALEIDEEIVQIARKYFAVPDNDERLKVLICDGVEYIENFDGKCDFIISDTYDEKNGLVEGLHTEKHFLTCHQILREDGVMTVNVYRPGPEWGADYIKMLQSIFAEVYVTIITPDQYVVTLCKKGLVPRYPAILARAEKMEPKLSLSLPAFLASFPKIPK